MKLKLKTEFIHIRVRSGQKKALIRAAKNDGLTLSEFVLSAAKKQIDQDNKVLGRDIKI